MDDISFVPAVAADLHWHPRGAPRARCELPAEDLGPIHLDHFVVSRKGDQLAGVVGLEIKGELGLLRSLAVAPELRGRRLGYALWTRIHDKARQRGIRRLYLLTTTAEALFSRWGFQRIPRDVVPEAIRATTEFASLCPATASVMVIDLARSSRWASTLKKATRTIAPA